MSATIYLGIGSIILGIILGVIALIIWVSTKNASIWFWVLLALGITLLIIGIVVCYYGKRNRDKERKKKADQITALQTVETTTKKTQPVAPATSTTNAST